MFGTETLANRGGAAARHGARLVLLTTVCDAMLRSITWTAGAAIKLACSFSPMLDANTTCVDKVGAAFRRAHFRFTTTMLTAPSFCYRFGSSRADAERAEPEGAVFLAKVASFSSCTTPSS